MSDELVMRCPLCRREITMPPNWQELMEAREDWDGMVRCDEGHIRVAMVPIPPTPEQDEQET